jgi:hypothetical protein
MEGLKYKLAHKRAEIGKWSSTNYAQKERLIQILEDSVDQLKKEMAEAAK